MEQTFSFWCKSLLKIGLQGRMMEGLPKVSILFTLHKWRSHYETGYSFLISLRHEYSNLWYMITEETGLQLSNKSTWQLFHVKTEIKYSHSPFTHIHVSSAATIMCLWKICPPRHRGRITSLVWLALEFRWRFCISDLWSHPLLKMWQNTLSV